MNRNHKGANPLHWFFNPAPTLEHYWVMERPIAHRGLFAPAQGIPENSMAAFQRAVDAGFSIELDVRLLADGQLAVFHDRELWRMTGEMGTTERLTAAAFCHLRFLLDNQHPPLLAEVLALVGDKVGVLVEIKDSSVQAAQAVIRVAQGHPGRWAALSFHAEVIAWFARHHPQVTRGLNGGVFEWDAGFLSALGMRSFLHAAASQPHFLGCYLKRLRSPVPRWLRSRGLPLIAWTARSQEDYQSACQHGDAVIFEGFLPQRYDM